MEAHLGDDVEVDTPSHTIPDTGDVVDVDSSSDIPSVVPSVVPSDTPSDAPLDTIFDTEDVTEVDTSSDKPSDAPLDAPSDAPSDTTSSSGTLSYASSDPIFDLEASTDLDWPLPPASELGLVDLQLKVIAEAETYRRLAIPDNKATARNLYRALRDFGDWACTTNTPSFERLEFLDTHDDRRAYDIGRLMRLELDKVSKAINELLDFEVEAAHSAAGYASTRPLSPVEEKMVWCRDEVENIIQKLEELRNETDSYWPGPIPDQSE